MMAGMRALVLAGAAIGGMATTQPPPASAVRTVQQEFDAAEALAAGTDPAASLAAWVALEKRITARPRSRGIVLVRKSDALFRLDRSDEAVAAARQGLALLPTDDRSLRPDRFRAYLNIAALSQVNIDYGSAIDAYRKAEDLADDTPGKLSALRGLIQTATFVDPDVAVAAAARADALIATTKVDAPIAADFASARGILALNRGDLARATTETKAAVKLLGGLTERTDLRDVAARSNAAIALLLSGRKDDARQYMAMTGAGRLHGGNLNPGPMMTPPDCGGETGLKPADMAVVQFSIADNGSVTYVSPIYAAGGGKVALEFARAARRWTWTPEQVKAIPSFLRYNARVELRCNMAFARPSVGEGLWSDLDAWAASRGQPIADAPPDPWHALDAQRAALKAAEAAPDSIATLPALVALANAPVLPREERGVLLRRALAIARRDGAPATALLALDLAARSSDSLDQWKPAVFRRLATPMLTEAPYAQNAQARSALRLILADTEQKGSGKFAEPLLNDIVADPALAANDPLKVGALIRLASIAQQRGDDAAARTTFARTGLAADQCAIIDRPPTLLHAGGTFPQEAQAWGFEGWTTTQFDVAANGKVQGARAIVAYPPFVFTKAGEDTMRTAAYTKSYRPDGGLGCGASTQRVMFRLPGS